MNPLRKSVCCQQASFAGRTFYWGAIRNHAQATMIKRSFRASAVFSKEDYYKTLGIPKTASKSEIKKKYFELAKK